ncbi:uncharacterized protein [Saccopteryx leptura]|uniref:uncharacterized protein n=1 Tax=Saccopteryx leptura TaxID=249018 RepID=UPI00339BB58A
MITGPVGPSHGRTAAGGRAGPRRSPESRAWPVAATVTAAAAAVPRSTRWVLPADGATGRSDGPAPLLRRRALRYRPRPPRAGARRAPPRPHRGWGGCRAARVRWSASAGARPAASRCWGSAPRRPSGSPEIPTRRRGTRRAGRWASSLPNLSPSQAVAVEHWLRGAPTLVSASLEFVAKHPDILLAQGREEQEALTPICALTSQVQGFKPATSAFQMEK